jgi:hypothetical protein
MRDNDCVECGMQRDGQDPAEYGLCRMRIVRNATRLARLCEIQIELNATRLAR